MLSYCLKCKENTKSKNPEVVKIKNGRLMSLSKFVVCKSGKWDFLKKQETLELLSSLIGIKIPILSDLFIVNPLFQKFKMNAIVNNFLLAINLCLKCI